MIQKVYEPEVRALIGTAEHFCKVVVLKLILLSLARVCQAPWQVAPWNFGMKLTRGHVSGAAAAADVWQGRESHHPRAPPDRRCLGSVHPRETTGYEPLNVGRAPRPRNRLVRAAVLWLPDWSKRHLTSMDLSLTRCCRAS